MNTEVLVVGAATPPIQVLSADLKWIEQRGGVRVGSRQAVRLRLLLFWLLLPPAVSAGPIERLTLAASPVTSFAPANLVVRVHVTPDPANRALEVIAESSDYHRSSRMQLDGEDAPKTITLEFRGPPHGDYTVRGRLIDSTGHDRAIVRQQVIVLAAGGGP
jgi:hypothetical protein